MIEMRERGWRLLQTADDERWVCKTVNVWQGFVLQWGLLNECLCCDL